MANRTLGIKKMSSGDAGLRVPSHGKTVPALHKKCQVPPQARHRGRKTQGAEAVWLGVLMLAGKWIMS